MVSLTLYSRWQPGLCESGEGPTFSTIEVKNINFLCIPIILMTAIEYETLKWIFKYNGNFHWLSSLNRVLILWSQHCRSMSIIENFTRKTVNCKYFEGKKSNKSSLVRLWKKTSIKSYLNYIKGNLFTIIFSPLLIKIKPLENCSQTLKYFSINTFRFSKQILFSDLSHFQQNRVKKLYDTKDLTVKQV